MPWRQGQAAIRMMCLNHDQRTLCGLLQQTQAAQQPYTEPCIGQLSEGPLRLRRPAISLQGAAPGLASGAEEPDAKMGGRLTHACGVHVRSKDGPPHQATLNNLKVGEVAVLLATRLPLDVSDVGAAVGGLRACTQGRRNEPHGTLLTALGTGARSASRIRRGSRTNVITPVAATASTTVGIME